MQTLIGWSKNLVWLYLVTTGNFFTLEWSKSSNFMRRRHKNLFLEKKKTLLIRIHIELLLPHYIKFGMENFPTSLPGLNKKVKKSKIPFSCTFLDPLEPHSIPITNIISKEVENYATTKKKALVNFGTYLYYSLNEFRYADLTNFQIPM